MDIKRLFFITGAPRSGTTYISDWISSAPGTYCVHETLPDIKGKTHSEILDYLIECAATGSDRYTKTLQRRFMKWDNIKLESDISLLGMKEPLVWPIDTHLFPPPLNTFLDQYDTMFIFIFRHPYDVISSGKHRAIHTENWPGFSVEEHCKLWKDSIFLCLSLMAKNKPILCIRWEEILLDNERTRHSIENYLGIKLQAFNGYEHQHDYLNTVMMKVSTDKGVFMGDKRLLLTEKDKDIITKNTSELCSLLGYKF